MADWHDRQICYPHAYTGTGRCPQCAEETEQKRAKEIERWNSLTIEQKLEELHIASSSTTGEDHGQS